MAEHRRASKRITILAAFLPAALAVAPVVAQVGGPGTAYGTRGPGPAYHRGHYPTAPAVPNGVPRMAPNVVLGWGGLPPPQYDNFGGLPPIGQPYYGPPGVVQGVPVAPGTIPGTVQVLPLQPAPYDPWAPR